MICPECGDFTPPGPLDVRLSAPSLNLRRETAAADAGMLSRLLKVLRLLRRSQGNMIVTQRRKLGDFSRFDVMKGQVLFPPAFGSGDRRLHKPEMPTSQSVGGGRSGVAVEGAGGAWKETG